MKKIILLFLVLITLNSEAQTTISDTSLIAGITNYTAYPGTSLTVKDIILGNEMINRNSIVIITGAHSFSPNVNYFQIAYQGKLFYLNRDYITLKDNSINFFKSVLNLDKKITDSLKVRGLELSKLYFLKEKLKAIEFIDFCKKRGLLIKKKSIYDESEYTQGTSFECEVVNLSSKPIKYITFLIQGYNAVNDKVSSIKMLKGIGPIGNFESSKYSFDYVWMTDIIDSYKLISIKIQYMDGSIKTITDTNSIFDENGNFDLYLKILEEEKK
ncbi:MAG: hypothetical protein FGM61_00945 [Sediminibacterium sp.]|nr:hypothetical protein [Sediminibacterium sp.]